MKNDLKMLQMRKANAEVHSGLRELRSSLLQTVQGFKRRCRVNVLSGEEIRDTMTVRRVLNLI
jgi:hypothetical protein